MKLINWLFGMAVLFGCVTPALANGFPPRPLFDRDRNKIGYVSQGSSGAVAKVVYGRPTQFYCPNCRGLFTDDRLLRDHMPTCRPRSWNTPFNP